MTTITIDRELLEQALVALSAPNHCVFSEPPICVDIRAALAAPATAPTQPAWYDAPTVPGLWFCDEGDENPYRFTCHNVSIPLNPHLVGEGERWFGPIPPDGDKP
jgi:hypothetical protein